MQAALWMMTKEFNENEKKHSRLTFYEDSLWFFIGHVLPHASHLAAHTTRRVCACHGTRSLLPLFLSRHPQPEWFGQEDQPHSEAESYTDFIFQVPKEKEISWCYLGRSWWPLNFMIKYIDTICKELSESVWHSHSQMCWSPIAHPTRSLLKTPRLCQFERWLQVLEQSEHWSCRHSCSIKKMTYYVSISTKSYPETDLPYSHLHHSGNRAVDGKVHTPAQSVCRLCHSWRMLTHPLWLAGKETGHFVAEITDKIGFYEDDLLGGLELTSGAFLYIFSYLFQCCAFCWRALIWKSFSKSICNILQNVCAKVLLH